MTLTYEDATGMMKGARNGRRKLGNNTYLEERLHPDCDRDNCPKHPIDYAVRLHRTDVVTLHPDGSQTLNSGGWRTVTTKDRINAYSMARVWSDRGEWKVAMRTRRAPAQYFRCGGCDHYHPLGWTGDCRDDSMRFTDEDLDTMHGAFAWDEVEEDAEPIMLVDFDKPCNFADGMRVYPDGRIVGADPVAGAVEHRENARA